jgi:hypothetical protein
MVKKHGLSRDPTYRRWYGMLYRCRDEDNPYYGGAGVTVDPRWEVFENFLADMGERPDGLTLERRDRGLPYGPGNCEWADWSTQNNNRSINRVVTLDGRTQTLTQWAAELGVPWTVVFNRVSAGWSVEEALTAPVDSARSVAAAESWDRGRKRGPHLITADGRTQSMSEWAREVGVRPQVIRNRIKAGWPEEVAVTTAALSRSRGADGRLVWDLPAAVIENREKRC